MKSIHSICTKQSAIDVHKHKKKPKHNFRNMMVDNRPLKNNNINQCMVRRFRRNFNRSFWLYSMKFVFIKQSTISICLLLMFSWYGETKIETFLFFSLLKRSMNLLFFKVWNFFDELFFYFQINKGPSKSQEVYVRKNVDRIFVILLL